MRHALTAVFATLLALACLAFSANGALAQVAINASANPSKFQVSVNAPTTVTVVWSVSRSSPPIAGTTSSSRAKITLSGVTIDTLGNALSRTWPAVNALETTSFTETLTIPSSVVFRAVKSGQTLRLIRTFSDTGGATDTASATLAPAGPGSEAFTVSRLDLHFDDQSRVKVLPKGSRLRAVAELNTTGSGLIIGQWEVASGATTAGAAVFQPFALVRRPVAGGRRTILVSPPLPTRFEGTNLVRLRLTDTDAPFDDPELQYYVTPEHPLPDGRQARLLLMTAPESGTPLTLTTRFAWQGIPGARVYKLEIFTAAPGPGELPVADRSTANVPLDPSPNTQAVEGSRPLAGIVLPATLTEVRLQDYTLAHLPRGRRYLWTVKALAEDGALLGVSPPREIYKP